MKHKTFTGFTLIELLVVVGVIGLLAAVILGSISSARGKGKDAKVKQSATEIRKLLEFEYGDSSSYVNLLAAWFPDAAACNAGFNGTYAVNMRAICSSAVTTIGATSPGGGIYPIFIGAQSVITTRYTIMMWLPHKGRYYCIGSNGEVSETTDGSTWNAPGCYADTT